MARQFLHALVRVGVLVSMFCARAACAQSGTVVLAMTEVPTQPVNGLSVSGITFHYTQGGAASNAALYNAGNGGQLRFVQDPALVGPSNGTLTLDFARPVVDLQFGAALSTSQSLPEGVVVTLFDPALNPIGSFPLAVSLLVANAFSEAHFTSPTTRTIGRAVLTFNSSVALQFAIDNLTVTFVDPGIVAGGDAFQVSYAANLALGDSLFNITNVGTLTAADGVPSNLCINVYAFSPDEFLMACCSCKVTPNALVSISALHDMLPNTLGPGSPNSLVVKLLASSGPTCNAALVPAAGVVGGLRAWSTTVHPTPVAQQIATTEKPFQPVLLSAGELARVTTFCGFIQANGSGFGICRSCRPGGQ